MSYNPYVTTIPTVGMLFDSYLESLKKRNASCADHMDNILSNAKAFLGNETKASEVSPESVCAWLGTIYARGSISMADRARAYLKAAFNYGMKAKYDYRSPNSVQWNIQVNPIDSIPTDRGASTKVHSRFFDREELGRFITLLDNDLENVSARALLLCLSIGCRIQEGSFLQVKMFDSEKGIIRWNTTKTGQPHQVALGSKIWEMMNEWCKGKDSESFIFPSPKDASKPVSSDTILKYFKRLGFKDAEPRSACRRTLKSMGQVAGITLDMLNIIQNHSSDRSVSTLNYNRYSLTEDAMIKMRQALNQWEEFLSHLQVSKMVA